MGGITITPPPTEGAGPPPPDLVAEGKLTAQGLDEGGWGFTLWKALFGPFGKFLLWMIRGISKVLERLVSVIMLGFTTAQGQESPEFDDAVAAVLSDLLGVQVAADTMKRARARGGRVPEMQQVGAAFLSVLLGESGANLNLNAEPGAQPALVFLGFVMSFAVRQGNVAFLSELLTARFGEQFRAYGENMANYLSLGRLSRLALRPVMDDVIAKPLQDVVRKLLRPTDLNAAEAIRTFNRGLITPEVFGTTMAKLGYSDDLIAALQTVYLSHLAPDEILALWRYNDITADQALERLTDLGYTVGDADLLQKAHAHLRTDSAVDFYLGVLREQVRAGYFGADTFRALLDLLPLTDEFKERERKIVGQILEQPRHRLTLAEMRKFYAEGLIDLSDWSDFLVSEGYSDLSQKLLTFDLLQGAGIEADKLAAASLVQQLKDLVTAKKAIKAGLLPAGSPPP